MNGVAHGRRWTKSWFDDDLLRRAEAACRCGFQTPVFPLPSQAETEIARHITDASSQPSDGPETTAGGARTPASAPPAVLYTFDGAWQYTRADGWREVAGTHPLPPCPDRPVRHLRIVPDGWTT